MKIIISPAKKMKTADDLPWRDLPAFLEKTDRLLAALRAMPAARLKSLWKCSDAIAGENLRRLERMDLRRGLTPAILSYEGIQYRYMAPDVFTDAQFDYLQELASKEYSDAVAKHLPPSVRLVRCVFGEEQEGRVVEKGTLCKMARGEMVRYMAEMGAERPEDLLAFDRLGYH